MTNKLILAALAASAVALPGAASAQRLPAAVIAVVDTTRVSNECNACRNAIGQLQGLATQLQARQAALAAPIQAEQRAIQAAMNALPQAQRANPPAALQTRIQAWERSQQTANQELGLLQNNLRSTEAHVNRQIEARLNPIINQVMVQRGANLAIDTQATLARSTGLDITNDVLNALNTALPSVSVTPLPQQPAPAPAQQPQQQPTGR